MIIKTAERIKELREQRGLSQAELAHQFGITRSSVNAWEMGVSNPKIDKYLHIVTDLAPKNSRKTLRYTTNKQKTIWITKAPSGMCKITDLTDRYEKTIMEYNTFNDNKVFAYLNEVVGISETTLNTVIRILKA